MILVNATEDKMQPRRRFKRNAGGPGDNGLDCLFKAKQVCSIISQTSGPFEVCHKMQDRNIWHYNCINDVCINETFACEILEAYAALCGRYGSIGNWRNVTNCSELVKVLVLLVF